MGATEVFRRTIARTTATYKGKLARGRISGSNMAQLAHRTAEASPGLAILDASLAPLSYGWLRDMCIATRGADPNLLVVIDSLHAWAAKSAPTDETEYQTLNRAMVDLQQLSGELQCPIVFVAERSKFAMQSGGISASAGSRKLEYGSDTMLELARDEDEPENAGEWPVTLRFTKNRNGRGGVTVPMRFHGGFMRFREATALEVVPGEVKTSRHRRRGGHDRERADLA
jgi:replicative DNA helicase